MSYLKHAILNLDHTLQHFSDHLLISVDLRDKIV